ncbi:Radical SAM superfamily protein, partial [Candidatus Magnetomorum sp. HK-1]
MLNIALLDLNHNTLGIHTNTVPLGICLIAKYLQKTIPNSLDIRLFKLADKALEVFEYWKPDVLGISQYAWNSDLNLFFSHHVKRINPNCFIVAGGPNLDFSKKSRISYLKKHTYIDACVVFDGEIPFSTIVKKIISGESIDYIKTNPVPGTYSLDPETENLIISKERCPRLETLDEFGPIYAEELCSDFLEQGFHPFLQTHRGCPFSCTFCHTGDQYYSKMIFQSPDIFEQDMDFLGFRNRNKPNTVLYMANTNMSLFKEDFEIAKIIRKSQQKYGWPKLININSGKNPDKLLEMQSIINFQPAIALQTLTPKVLKNVKRVNIPFPDFVNFQNKVSKITGNPTATELILCLPGETKTTFIQTLEKVMNSGIENIAIFTLMKLKGTPLSTEETERKNGYVTKYRIVPRQFSVVNDIKIFDTEAVIVASNTMSFEDYLELRGLS